MSDRANAPTIVRRKKVVQGEGHHGGAWKVAYADFVTAMMAFFLLMWLLGATNEKQRIVFGGRNRLSRGDFILRLRQVRVDTTQSLKRDHRACVGKDTGHFLAPISLRRVFRKEVLV